jgi:hypothetical protein
MNILHTQYFAYIKTYTSEILGFHNGAVAEWRRTERPSSYRHASFFWTSNSFSINASTISLTNLRAPGSINIRR